MPSRRVRIRITGRVQGVWFRSHTEKKALELGLAGHVRNVEDGSVEVVAEGDPPAIESLIRWTWDGSPLARVEHVEVDELPPTCDDETFRIDY